MIAMFLLITCIIPCLLAFSLGMISIVVLLGMDIWVYVHPILAIAYYLAVLFCAVMFIKRKVNEYCGKGYFINMWKEKRAKRHG